MSEARTRCYDRSDPNRYGWVTKYNEGTHTATVEWDDDSIERMRDADSLGHVPPEHIAETLRKDPA